MQALLIFSMLHEKHCNIEKSGGPGDKAIVTGSSASEGSQAYINSSCQMQTESPHPSTIPVRL